VQEQRREDERDEKIALVKRMAEETREGREVAAMQRAQREAAEARKRERLKAAFIQKQLELIKAKKQQKGGSEK
jgi:hypothetical protein